jgi:hypothetical protein
MNVTKLVSDLKEYKDQLDEAIAVLERLAGRRGAAAAPKRKMSAATKKKMAAAQKRRWEAYRKQA